MVESKWIGLALAMSSSLAIGASSIIQKKGLAEVSAYGEGPVTDGVAYMKNPVWWAGLVIMVIGEVANFAAYTFAPPIMVTPLGALSVLIAAVMASFLLNEELGHLGRLGCALSLIGSVIIVLHAPEDVEIETVDQILAYAVQPGFLLYILTVLVFSMVMIYVVSPRSGRTNPMVFISICSVVGSVSVMAIKGFGVAIKLTLEGKNQLMRPSTYVFGLVFAFCVVVQLNYYNKALDTFSVNIVNPMYYVGFSSATIVSSLILFQGFNTTDATNTLSLLCGFIVTFLGVHILNISRVPDPVDGQNGHAPLENGILQPRLSLTGRLSLDGWHGGVEGRRGMDPSPRTPRTPRTPFGGHGRRNSRGSSTLFNAFGVDDDVESGRVLDNVGLEQLREEDESDESDADERTHLRTRSEGGAGIPTSASSQKRSPITPGRRIPP